MPRIKRWFPVSHEIHSDPEMWELRDGFGDRAAFVWLEMLAIADRNDGKVGPNLDSLRNTLASRCRTSRTKVEAVLAYGAAKGWIRLGEDVWVAKFAKYHRFREANGNDKGADQAPLRTEPYPSEPSELKDAPGADCFNEKKKLDPEIKLAADRLYAARPELFPRMIVWIKRKEREGYTAGAIAAALNRFESSAAAPEDWWPYLDKILARARTEILQGESEIYKRADAQQAGAVLRRIMEGLK